MFLAKSAEVHDGLITMIGGTWDTVRIPKQPGRGPYPPTIMRGTLVARLLLTREEAQVAHPLQVAVRAAGRGDLAGLFAVVSTEVAPDLPSGWDIGVPITVDLTGVALPGPGFYEVVVRVEEALLGVTKFRILEEPGITGILTPPPSNPI